MHLGTRKRIDVVGWLLIDACHLWRLGVAAGPDICAGLSKDPPDLFVGNVVFLQLGVECPWQYLLIDSLDSSIVSESVYIY